MNSDTDVRLKAHIFQALIVRCIYLLHSVIILWRVVIVRDSELFWIYSVFVGIIVLEGLVIIVKRKGVEFKWFSSCILTYSLVNVPSIWQLELFRNNNPSTTNTTSIGTSNSVIPIYLNDETWIFGLEQTFLLCIIFGRWLLPKGSLSRDKLSSLLLLLIGKACDVTDFFTLINETKVRADTNLVYAILSTWSVSVVQFTFVLTETESPSGNSSSRQITQLQKVLLGTDVWCCTISVFMEELPFLIMRTYTIATHNITSYSTLFFITKNVLLLLMLFYRILSVFCEEFEIHWPVVPITTVRWSHDTRQTSRIGNGLDLGNVDEQLRSGSTGISTRSYSLHTINSTVSSTLLTEQRSCAEETKERNAVH
ncbi:transmembrane protein 26-like [Mytilus trossulus]|uniref:transmembrane protein 26-like n=1 Tax=Mytilus trossulus TaxID=6551 RepID=UPI003004457D